MNKQQANAFVILPRITGAMSTAGSFWICYEILTSQKKMKNIQQRIILGMATTDLITSITYIMGTAPFAEVD